MDNIVAQPVSEIELTKPSADSEANRQARLNPKPITVDATKESPETSFSNYGKIPYTAKYLGVEDFYKIDPEGTTKVKITEIEAFLLKRMAGDNIVFAQAWLDKLAGELSFREDEQNIAKMNRLHAYVKAKERIEKEALLKRLMLQKIEKENG